MPRAEISIEVLRQQLVEMHNLLAREPDVLPRRAPSVSEWGVTEQLDHMLKVFRAVSGMVLRAEEQHGGKLNLLGRAILFTGFIPRGRGESPAAVRGSVVTRDELGHALEKCRKLLDETESRESRESRPNLPIFPHPFFGCLTDEEALRFLVVHNRHHFRIVRDILKAARPTSGAS